MIKLRFEFAAKTPVELWFKTLRPCKNHPAMHKDCLMLGIRLGQVAGFTKDIPRKYLKASLDVPVELKSRLLHLCCLDIGTPPGSPHIRSQNLELLT